MMSLDQVRNSKKLSIDIMGTPAGTGGWATHTLEFSRAMREFSTVNLRTHRVGSLKLLFNKDRGMLLNGMFKKKGDFCVVIAGKHYPKELTARWIVWETTELPGAQRKLCDSAQYLWVPSHWGRENLMANGYAPERIFVVPEGVATDFYTPSLTLPKKNKFRFLMVGKWEERKFTEALVRAFCKEFKSTEAVELYLQAHNKLLPNFSLSKKIAELNIANTEHIICGAPCSKFELRDLYRSADCFVLPTRAEGWGLPILESMACGIPAIVTRYSAPLDYVTENNGYLLNVAKMVPAQDPEFGINTGLWAEPDVEHLCALMRLAFEKQADLREKGQQAHLDAQAYSWQKSALAATNVINNLV